MQTETFTAQATKEIQQFIFDSRYQTSLTIYVDDEVVLELEDIKTKYVYKFIANAKEILILTRNAKIELDPVDFYNLVKQAMIMPDNNISTGLTEVDQNLQLYISCVFILTPSPVKREFNLLLKRVDIKDVDRMVKMIKDVDDLKKEIYEIKDNIESKVKLCNIKVDCFQQSNLSNVKIYYGCYVQGTGIPIKYTKKNKDSWLLIQLNIKGAFNKSSENVINLPNLKCYINNKLDPLTTYFNKFDQLTGTFTSDILVKYNSFIESPYSMLLSFGLEDFYKSGVFGSFMIRVEEIQTDPTDQT